MRIALLIAGKDLRRRLRDRSAYIVGIIAPLGLAAIFSFVFNPISDSSFNATFGVVNNDNGEVSAMFVGQVLGGLAADQEGVKIVEITSAEEATARVEQASDPASDGTNEISAAFVIPAGFTNAVQAGQGTTLEIIGSPVNSTSAAIAAAVAKGFADEISAVNLEVRTYAASGGVIGPSTVTDALAYPSPITVGDLAAETRRLDDTTTMTVGMAIMFLFFVAQEGVLGLLEERRDGTLSRLLAAPISRASILGGKAIASYVLGISSMTVLAVASTLLLHANWGKPVGVAILILAATFAAVGIMAVVSGLAKTDEQANTYTAIVAIALAILGGSFFPVSQAGGAVQLLSKVTPHAWFIQGLGDLAAGRVSAVVLPALVLVVIGIVSSTAAVLIVRKVVDR